jgi:hypothetical protein
MPPRKIWKRTSGGCGSRASLADLWRPHSRAPSRWRDICASFCAASRERAPRFSPLLQKVVSAGTHAADSIASTQAAKLLREVETVLHSSDILSEAERGFFTDMKSLCEASLATGDPILF